MSSSDNLESISSADDSKVETRQDPRPKSEDNTKEQESTHSKPTKLNLATLHRSVSVKKADDIDDTDDEDDGNSDDDDDKEHPTIRERIKDYCIDSVFFYTTTWYYRLSLLIGYLSMVLIIFVLLLAAGYFDYNTWQ